MLVMGRRFVGLNADRDDWHKSANDVFNTLRMNQNLSNETVARLDAHSLIAYACGEETHSGSWGNYRLHHTQCIFNRMQSFLLTLRGDRMAAASMCGVDCTPSMIAIPLPQTYSYIAMY